MVCKFSGLKHQHNLCVLKCTRFTEGEPADEQGPSVAI